MLTKISTEIKKWNWTLFIVIICTVQIGTLSNKNIDSISFAFLFGLIIGIVIGLPAAILTKTLE